MSHLRKTPSRSRPVISDRVIGRSNRMLVNRLTNDKSPLCQRAYLLSPFLPWPSYQLFCERNESN